MTQVARFPLRQCAASCVVLALTWLATAAPAQEWAGKAGGTGADQANAITRDTSGNLYVSGAFEGTSTFGSGGNAVMRTSAGRFDAFLAKYNSAGDLIWVVQAGGSSASLERGYGVAVDGDGNVYYTGTFVGTATFGVAPNTVTLTNAGQADVFLAKHASDGTLLWAQRFGGIANETFIGGVATDSTGNVYLAAAFAGTASFEPNAEYSVISSGGFDVCLVKYAANGNVLWAQTGGGNSDDLTTGIAVDSADKVHVAGNLFSSLPTFGSGAQETTVTLRGPADAFIAKYAPNGALQWIRNAGGFGSVAQSRNIAVDPSGNVILAGDLRGREPFSARARTRSRLAVSQRRSRTFSWRNTAARELSFGRSVSAAPNPTGPTEFPPTRRATSG